MGTLLDFLIEHLPQFRRARLASLYSDFRQQRQSNPDGYAANLAAWEAALSFAAESQAIPGCSNSLSVSAGQGLLEALESKEWGTPSALGTVFTEAVSNSRFVPKSVFLQSKSGLVETSNSSVSWKLVSWAMKQLGVTSWIADQMPEGVYVISANLKKAHETMLPWLSEDRGRVDRIWPMSEFKTKTTELLSLQNTISGEDLQIILTYLSRDCRLLAHGENFVKLGASSGSLKITQEDHSVASLKSLIYDIASQVRQVSIKVDDLDKQARDAVTKKNKTAALRYLRYKKIQEALLNQRSDTLLQLEDVLHQIEQAANQVEVMSVLKSSTSVLKGLNAELGDLDTLQDVLDGISEEMLKTKEISGAIGDTTQAGLVIDDGEINDELEALESEIRHDKVETEVQGVQETLEHLPAVQELPTVENRTTTNRGQQLATV